MHELPTGAHLPFPEQAAVKIRCSYEYSRPMNASVRQYIQCLIQHNLIDEQLKNGYLSGYEQARSSRALINEECYMDVMKHLAAILRHTGYRLHLEAERPSSRPGHPCDDDVVSLAQSVGTLSSRSTTLSRRLRSPRIIEEQDNQQHIRKFVMARLMIDDASSLFLS